MEKGGGATSHTQQPKERRSESSELSDEILAVESMEVAADDSPPNQPIAATAPTEPPRADSQPRTAHVSTPSSPAHDQTQPVQTPQSQPHTPAVSAPVQSDHAARARLADWFTRATHSPGGAFVCAGALWLCYAWLACSAAATSVLAVQYWLYGGQQLPYNPTVEYAVGSIVAASIAVCLVEYIGAKWGFIEEAKGHTTPINHIGIVTYAAIGAAASVCMAARFVHMALLPQAGHDIAIIAGAACLGLLLLCAAVRLCRAQSRAARLAQLMLCGGVLLVLGGALCGPIHYGMASANDRRIEQYLVSARQAIERAVDLTGSVPEDLGHIKQIIPPQLHAQLTAQGIRYQRLPNDVPVPSQQVRPVVPQTISGRIVKYQLCARFDHATSTVAHATAAPHQPFAIHAKGHQCFRLGVRMD